MKRYVDGIETELDADGASVRRGPDRLYASTPAGTESAVAVRQGEAILVSYRGAQYRVERNLERAAKGRSADSGEFVAPMPGSIVDIQVAAGQSVAKGDRLYVFEAMKTQQPTSSPFDGVVEAVLVQVGEQVVEGQPLMIVKPVADTHA